MHTRIETLETIQQEMFLSGDFEGFDFVSDNFEHATRDVSVFDEIMDMVMDKSVEQV